MAADVIGETVPELLEIKLDGKTVVSSDAIAESGAMRTKAPGSSAEDRS